jgi:SpoVK/Ycf46/Vps4 family AAA+-type ATPase
VEYFLGQARPAGKLGDDRLVKRVVNSFLQMMDGFRGKSILIAATNHERLLDKALWRRFDEVLFFERPNLEQIRQLLMVKLRGVRYDLPLEDRLFLNQFNSSLKL